MAYEDKINFYCEAKIFHNFMKKKKIHDLLEDRVEEHWTKDIRPALLPTQLGNILCIYK